MIYTAASVLSTLLSTLSKCFFDWPDLQLRVYLMTFIWPFTSVTSPEGGIVIMWSTSRIFIEVTLFQHICLKMTLWLLIISGKTKYSIEVVAFAAVDSSVNYKIITCLCTDYYVDTCHWLHLLTLATVDGHYKLVSILNAILMLMKFRGKTSLHNCWCKLLMVHL